MLSVAISDEVSNITQKTAQDILSIRKLHLKIQQRLTNMLVSGTVSDKQKNIVTDIFAWNAFIDISIDRSLVNRAISDKTSDAVKAMIRRIFYVRTIPTAIQQTLLEVVISDKVSDTTRNMAEAFLIETNLDLELEEKLQHIIKSPAFKRKVKKIARAILTRNRLIRPYNKDSKALLHMQG